jgi:hypothetical protein
MSPFVLIADVHLHQWSQFAEVTHYGANSRLAGLHSEITRAAITVKQKGGKRMVVAGDLFHVRGSIAPSVLNPTLDIFKAIVDMGIEVLIIPGNHDLEGKDSERVSSAVTALEGVGCRVIHETELIVEGDMLLVPWFDNVTALKDELAEQVRAMREDGFDPAKNDLIIHAPVNGVIKGIPEHGLESTWLAELGFRRVFAGHYHNHTMTCPGIAKPNPAGTKGAEDEFLPGYGPVYSIGALAHHTWSDVGSKAGFLIVGEEHPDNVKHYPSQLPKFVDFDESVLDGDSTVNLPFKGNFVRLKTHSTKLSDINQAREALLTMGAKGVVIVSVPKPAEERTGAIASSVSAGASIQQSISEFIKTMGVPVEETVKAIELGAMQVLAEAEVA